MKTRLPLSVRDFYIGIYMKKHNNDKENISKLVYKEAILSWKSLEPQEKQIILQKYKDTSAIFQAKFGTYLKAAQPIVKRKENKPAFSVVNSPSNTISYENDEYIIDNENPADNPHKTNSNEKKQENGGIFMTLNLDHLSPAQTETYQSLLDNLPPPPDPPQLIHTKVTECLVGVTMESYSMLDRFAVREISMEFQLRYVPEPENLPSLTLDPRFHRLDSHTTKNPKDLYEKVNSTVDVPSYLNLSRLEKRPYQAALLAVKRRHLKKYESYLHSLTDHELYKHMIDVVNKEMF